MTEQTLPDEPDLCFAPAYDVETDVQQIRIAIEGPAGHVPPHSLRSLLKMLSPFGTS